MGDNNSPIDEEVEAMCETDGMTYFRAGQLATDACKVRPELADKIERQFRPLDCDDWVSSCIQRWTRQCNRRVESR